MKWKVRVSDRENRDTHDDDERQKVAAIEERWRDKESGTWERERERMTPESDKKEREQCRRAAPEWRERDKETESGVVWEIWEWEWEERDFRVSRGVFFLLLPP